jgi:hypothetical protein
MAAKLPTASPYKVVGRENQQPEVHTVCPPYPHRDTLCVHQGAWPFRGFRPPKVIIGDTLC